MKRDQGRNQIKKAIKIMSKRREAFPITKLKKIQARKNKRIGQIALTFATKSRIILKRKKFKERRRKV
jgi:hypothetical protein